MNAVYQLHNSRFWVEQYKRYIYYYTDDNNQHGIKKSQLVNIPTCKIFEILQVWNVVFLYFLLLIDLLKLEKKLN